MASKVSKSLKGICLKHRVVANRMNTLYRKKGEKKFVGKTELGTVEDNLKYG